MVEDEDEEAEIHMWVSEKLGKEMRKEWMKNQQTFGAMFTHAYALNGMVLEYDVLDKWEKDHHAGNQDRSEPLPFGEHRGIYDHVDATKNSRGKSRIMDFRSLLLNFPSGAEKDLFIREVIGNRENFESLLDLALYDKDPVAWRAAWMLDGSG